MKKETWNFNEDEIKDALKMPKRTSGKGYKKRNNIRWTKQEEKYLLENIKDLGIEAVSIKLRRSPIAVRSKFLRASGLIDKKGRMTVSLKNNPVNSWIPVIKQVNNNNDMLRPVVPNKKEVLNKKDILNKNVDNNKNCVHVNQNQWISIAISTLALLASFIAIVITII